jgi:hypothetical protein
MKRSFACRVYALVAAASVLIGGGAAAEPQRFAEFVLHGLPSHPKWLPEEQPLFGHYLASGDGETAGAIVGRVFWDLYEDHSQADRHPTFFRGFVERDGHRYPFEIIGIYTPESADKTHWRISGAITFADKAVLGTEQQPIVGKWEASTRTSRFTIWADRQSQ